MKEKFRAILSRGYIAILAVFFVATSWNSLMRIEDNAKSKAFYQSVLEVPEVKTGSVYDDFVTHDRARQELMRIDVVEWRHIFKNLMFPVGIAIVWHVGEWIIFGSTSARPYKIKNETQKEAA